MTLPGALRARLLANATFAGLINKIAWGGLPQGTTLPYVKLTKVAPGRDWTHEGPIALVNPHAQIDIWAATDVAAQAIADALQAEMERLTRITVGGWEFLPPALLEGDRGPDVEDLTGGGKAYRIMHDYSFWARPS